MPLRHKKDLAQMRTKACYTAGMSVAPNISGNRGLFEGVCHGNSLERKERKWSRPEARRA